MINKPIEAITKADIEGLITNQIRESRTIEYKMLLPGKSDEASREFLADVSSFANTAGGDILYGIKANGGVPERIEGLKGNIDDEVLRLENILNRGVDPRIPGVKMQPIDGFPDGPVLLIRIPRSWLAPHMIIFKNLSRFFTRNSAGKHQMDVSEIRTSFLFSESIDKKIRLFRDERLARIVSGETPVLLREGAKLVLHLMPLTAFAIDSKFDVDILCSHWDRLRPVGASGISYRINFDGLVTYTSPKPTEQPSTAYCQIFRQGQIETVVVGIARTRLDSSDGKRFIRCLAYERSVIEVIEEYLSVLKMLNVGCPVYVMMTIMGVKGCHMALPLHPNFIGVENNTVIDKDMLLLPDILLTDYGLNMPEVLRPMFDAVWNACGYRHSLNYDAQGKWSPGGI